MDIFKLNSVIMVLYRAFHFLHQLSWHGMREMVKERCFFLVKEETKRDKTSLVRRKNALQGVTTLLVLIMVPNSIINIDG